MKARWFRVKYGGMEHQIYVRPHLRQYSLLVNGQRVLYTSHTRRWLEKNATLRILHHFQFWEYPPKKWKFGGDWT